MAIAYEWDIEQTADDEIVDHDFSETLANFDKDKLARALAKDGYELVLVRSEGNDVHGLTDRLWAYVTRAQLPALFNDGDHDVETSVPKRFQRELDSYKRRACI